MADTVTTTRPFTTITNSGFPWHRIVSKGDINIFWGYQQSGKSTLTNYYELLCLANGQRVLHIEKDEHRNKMFKRLSTMQEENNIPYRTSTDPAQRRFFAPEIKHLELDTPEGLETLKGMVRKYRPDLLVITPIGALAQGDLNTGKDTSAFINNVKEAARLDGLDCTVILHGHLNKKGLPTGSKYWDNLVDIAWTFEKIPVIRKGAPYRMIVTNTKDRADSINGFEWSLARPHHAIAFVRQIDDNMTLQDRIGVATVAGFVIDTHRDNYREWKKSQEKEDWEEELHGKKKGKKKVPDPWVTIPEFMEKHEGTLGGRTIAYRLFNLACDYGIILRLSNGGYGVQRFAPTEYGVAWLRENDYGHKGIVTPPASTPSNAIVQPVPTPTLPEKTEQEMTDEAWDAQPEEVHAGWLASADDDYELPAHLERAIEEEEERVAKRFREDE